MLLAVLIAVFISVMSRKTTDLNCYTFNATSIKGKLHEFNSHFHGAQAEFDCIAVQETWLSDEIYDGEILFNSDYNIFRRDRNALTSSKSTGGGVMLAIASHLSCTRREDLETALEIIWLQVKLDDANSAFVGNVYLPPDSKLDALELLEESLDKLSRAKKVNDSVIIFGDFNMRYIKWTPSGDGYANIDNPYDLPSLNSRFVEIVNSFELVQHNVQPTCNGNQLDLVLTNKLDAVVNVTDKATTSTHDALEVHVSLNVDSKKRDSSTSKRTVYNFKRADWDSVFLALLHLLG